MEILICYCFWSVLNMKIFHVIVSLSCLICNMGFLAPLSTPTNILYKPGVQSLHWHLRGWAKWLSFKYLFHEKLEHFALSSTTLSKAVHFFMLEECHCSSDAKDRALLFSFKSAIGGWRAKRELSFIMLPCQKDTTLCKRNDVEQKIAFFSMHSLSLAYRFQVIFFLRFVR